MKYYLTIEELDSKGYIKYATQHDCSFDGNSITIDPKDNLTISYKGRKYIGKGIKSLRIPKKYYREYELCKRATDEVYFQIYSGGWQGWIHECLLSGLSTEKIFSVSIDESGNLVKA